MILTKQHAPLMAALHAQCFDKAWSQADFQMHIENDYDIVMGVMDVSVLQGFIVLRTQVDQSEILTIAVDPTYQGKGIGATLLEMGLTQAQERGGEIVFLEVAKDNHAALALYKKAGFVACGIRPGYYKRDKGRVDALLFQKHLL